MKKKQLYRISGSQLYEWLFRARNVFGTFEKQAPDLVTSRKKGPKPFVCSVMNQNREFKKKRRQRQRLKINYLIGWKRTHNRAARAARFLAQLFDVVCQTPTWNFSSLSFWRQREPAAVNLSFFAFRLFCTPWPTRNNLKTLEPKAKFYCDVFVAAAVT